MNYQRFIGRNSREAMTKVRAAFGDAAVIIRNRPIAGGVEILATADDGMALPTAVRATAMDDADRSLLAPATTPRGPGKSIPGVPMSTLSFQDFVRERAATRDMPASDWLKPAEPEPAQAPTQAANQPSVQPDQQHASLTSEYQQPPAASSDGSMLVELRHMHSELTRQLSSLAWMNLRHRDPMQTQLLRTMIECGFSGALARTLTQATAVDELGAGAEQWQKKQLAKMIQTEGDASRLLNDGGVYALIGPTGSGKTTTVAKLAAQFALRHGVQSVGLVTVDAYRIGAQDQLRTFGRLLGVRVLVAHDANNLAGFLHEFMGKKLVLIDTGGLSQRDDRVRELISSLSSPMIRKLLVLNAASQAETIEDVLLAYRGRDAAGIVVSKIDEAVKLGNVLDCLIRHRLPLVGISNGQRVPEDWHAPDPAMLIERAFAAPRVGAFQHDDEQIVHLLRDQPVSASSHLFATTATRGAPHA